MLAEPASLSYKRYNFRIEAHRGAGFLEPENTIEAFEHAKQLDIDGVELDVYITRDGLPVVVHGDDNGIIEFVDSSKNDYPKNMDYNDFKDLEVKTGGRCPLLADVFLSLKNVMWINVEFKALEAVEAVVRLVNDLGVQDQVLYSSFIHEVKGELIKAHSVIGINRPFSFGFLIWQLNEFGNYPESWPGDSINIDFELYMKNREIVGKEIEKAKQMNMMLKFYIPKTYKETVDDFKIMESLRTDTIITDYPVELRKYQKESQLPQTNKV